MFFQKNISGDLGLGRRPRVSRTTHLVLTEENSKLRNRLDNSQRLPVLFRSIGRGTLLTNGVPVATKVVVPLLGFLYGE